MSEIWTWERLNRFMRGKYVKGKQYVYQEHKNSWQSAVANDGDILEPTGGFKGQPEYRIVKGQNKGRTCGIVAAKSLTEVESSDV